MSIYNCNGTTSDGRSWFFKVRYVNREGVTVRKNSKKFFTRSEAIKAQEDFIRTIETSGYDVPVSMNFSTLYKHFLEQRKDIVNFSTIKSYNAYFKHFKLLHKTKCVDFSAEQFEAWRREINATKLFSVRHKNNLLKFWKTLLNFGSAYYGFNFRDVYKKLNKFVDPGGLVRKLNYYTYPEFKNLLACEHELMFRCIWQMFYYCGLSVSELLPLTWKDLDLRNKTLNVNKLLLSNPPGSEVGYYISSPRNRATARIIPMQKMLVRDLRRYYESVYKTPCFKRTGYVFTFTNGLFPISSTTLHSRKKIVTLESGSKSVNFREFRHSCAYLLITNGADIVTVAGFLGLSEISDVYDLYSHFLPLGMTDVLGSINRLNRNK